MDNLNIFGSWGGNTGWCPLGSEGPHTRISSPKSRQERKMNQKIYNFTIHKKENKEIEKQKW